MHLEDVDDRELMRQHPRGADAGNLQDFMVCPDETSDLDLSRVVTVSDNRDRAVVGNADRGVSLIPIGDIDSVARSIGFVYSGLDGGARTTPDFRTCTTQPPVGGWSTGARLLYWTRPNAIVGVVAACPTDVKRAGARLRGEQQYYRSDQSNHDRHPRPLGPWEAVSLARDPRGVRQSDRARHGERDLFRSAPRPN